ncbi:hypothetical protein ACFT0E_33950, partial [Streptomyces sp. NPDC057052]
MTTPAAAAGTAPRSPNPAPGTEPAPPASEAPAAPAPRPEPRLRLRPGVAVTPLRAGLHLRGRGVGVTLEGSRALPALWRLLSARLAPDRAGRGDGGPRTDTGPQAGARVRTGTQAQAEAGQGADVRAQGDVRAQAEAGQGTDVRAQGAASDQADLRVEAALTALTARLREHDLVVEHPQGAELPPWPGSSAAHPAEAAEAIRIARPVVATPDPGCLLAVSLVRALGRAGASPRVIVDGRLAAGQAVITADAPDGAVALAVSCDTDGGFVTEPGPPHRARSDAAAVATRLGAASSPWAASGPATARSRSTVPVPAPSRTTSVRAGAPRQTAAAAAEVSSRTHVALLAG